MLYVNSATSWAGLNSMSKTDNDVIMSVFVCDCK